MSALLTNMKGTAHAVVDGYSAWEVEPVMAPRADNCTHQLYPKSLGRPLQTNDEYRTYFATVSPIFSDISFTIDNEIYDVDARKAALHLYSNGKSPIGDYNNEYSFFLTFTEDGSKITNLTEMTDSAYAGNFFKKLREFAEHQPEGSEAPWAKSVKAAVRRTQAQGH